MNLKDAAQEVKAQWRDFLPLVLNPAKEKVNNELSFICPFCGHGAHGDGLTYNPKSKTKTGLVCFGSCGFSGSDIDLYAQMTGRDANDTAQYVETVKEMAGMLNIAVDDQPPASNQPQTVTESVADPQPPRTPNTPGKYKNRILYAADDLYSDAGREALDYLHKRGLTDETLKKYMIGSRVKGEYFVKAHKEMPAVIFPHDAGYSYYSARSLTGKYFNKLTEAEAGSQTLYNGAALSQDKPVFIVEGQIDALSILQSGGSAAALAGGKWESVLLTRIAQKPPAAPLVLMLDNDDLNDQGHHPGQEAQEALAEALTKQGIPFIEARFDLNKYPGEKKKDANDLLIADAAQFERDVARIEAEALRALKPDNTADYIAYEMQGEIERLQQDARRKTGFSNLDAAIGSLYSGLIIIPGISSVGKSSFALQLTDQLAKGGQHVLLFSMEMSRLEMISKSISRYTRMQGEKGAVTSFQIRTGAKGERIEKATHNYLTDVGDRISIIEGNFDSDTTAITAYAMNYVARNKVTPVIVIDYVQVLQAATDPQTGRKPTDPRTAIDNNIVSLKRLSRDLQTPVIVVSSVNRGNYLAPLDFESLKESGALEFTADCIFGLQLACMNESLFTAEKDVIKKRERVKAAKSEIPRKIELTCLKNRYGKSSFSCMFEYFPQFDYFTPLEAGFKPVPEGEETPYDDYEQIPLF